MPGRAAIKALTVSSCPIIAAEKIVGRAPCVSRKSAIGLLPTCAAASMHVSQSPNPQSTDAHASAGCFSTASRTRAKLPCDAPTISRTRLGFCCGNASSGLMAGGASGAGWPHALDTGVEIPSAERPHVREKNERRDSDIDDLRSGYRKRVPFRARKFGYRLYRL